MQRLAGQRLQPRHAKAFHGAGAGARGLRRAVAARVARGPRAEVQQQQQQAQQQQQRALAQQDPFVAAALRLTRLVENVGDGEDELIESSLREEPPLSKLGLMAMGGGGIALAAVLVSALAGQDPLGGATLSAHSLGAAAVGAALALPLVAFRAYSWTPEAAEALPSLADMHRMMAEEAEPWLSRFNRGHLAAHAALETLPMTLLLLPAAQGGLAAAFEFWSSLLQSSLLGPGGGGAAAAAAAAAAATPQGLSAVLALLVTATCAGVVQSLNLVTDEEQLEVVRDAVQNADRYYRLTSMQVGSTADDATRASRAFKAVAVSWMEASEDASALAGAVTFVDVVMVSAIWYATGDLAAPAAAALAVAAVDYHHLHAAAARGGGRRGGKRGAEERRGPTRGESGSG
ncbi:hypothetical protein Rsub_10088 [Raphidocelis subcapitata]|uniref:Uncharacterized protein n=1 Tax=Raphidocelis subcapitata TaxID=307507 RepID=A0A2V0PIU3_9CHLO|nr:hypothetical protein Rsub_10088 [Raphidocelis subcapitata]|eukprot:GBF97227.1 hypothetical protein Rsub_10088 [Raphidocelis subcapitata]